MRAFGKLHRCDLPLVAQGDMEVALHRQNDTECLSCLTQHELAQHSRLNPRQTLSRPQASMHEAQHPVLPSGSADAP